MRHSFSYPVRYMWYSFQHEGSNSTDSSAGRDFLSPGALLQRIDSLWHVLSRFDVNTVRKEDPRRTLMAVQRRPWLPRSIRIERNGTSPRRPNPAPETEESSSSSHRESSAQHLKCVFNILHDRDVLFEFQ
ncbi:hypothetical protein CC2G_012995 [Coprinopsis cinerea AmutBmut pab1-1]|nr:hypothetical protein CC2G_012995 [Coprinopsis cinerea AmutBmut pab1-1]